MTFKEFLNLSEGGKPVGPMTPATFTPPKGPSAGVAKTPASNMSPGVQPIDPKPKGGSMSPASLDLTPRPKEGGPMSPGTQGIKQADMKPSPFSNNDKFFKPTNSDWPTKGKSSLKTT